MCNQWVTWCACNYGRFAAGRNFRTRKEKRNRAVKPGFGSVGCEAVTAQHGAAGRGKFVAAVSGPVDPAPAKGARMQTVWKEQLRGQRLTAGDGFIT